ncbi:AbrB/MazE/SpoVT family DNA-binding domain-containing protein [Rickettsiales endosymbiont of Peranema trichophorum]|uniref:AbrB/MazE/SpoVT family DNA-binding domain-containing protein n=1 Tax=Rickettsiales endosymbiont of Peranema trichophorum TaxID=2486577 RepID=UPI0013EE72FE|nr:AbrB/MazE/SpoVT family DNA-binding domain-containing protein [Rickettsiales endosymbiont of Peranema trichophorum]
MDTRATIDKNSRILIPTSIRKKLHYSIGDTVVLRAINGELHILKLEQIVAEAQQLVNQHYIPESPNIPDASPQQLYTSTQHPNLHNQHDQEQQ